MRNDEKVIGMHKASTSCVCWTPLSEPWVHRGDGALLEEMLDKAERPLTLWLISLTLDPEHCLINYLYKEPILSSSSPVLTLVLIQFNPVHFALKPLEVLLTQIEPSSTVSAQNWTQVKASDAHNIHLVSNVIHKFMDGWSCLEDITVPVNWMGSKGISLMSFQPWSQCFFAIIDLFLIKYRLSLRMLRCFGAEVESSFQYKIVKWFIFGLLSSTSLIHYDAHLVI